MTPEPRRRDSRRGRGRTAYKRLNLTIVRCLSFPAKLDNCGLGGPWPTLRFGRKHSTPASPRRLHRPRAQRRHRAEQTDMHRSDRLRGFEPAPPSLLGLPRGMTTGASRPPESGIRRRRSPLCAPGVRPQVVASSGRRRGDYLGPGRLGRLAPGSSTGGAEEEWSSGGHGQLDRVAARQDTAADRVSE
jgi:hypothetical protein